MPAQNVYDNGGDDDASSSMGWRAWSGLIWLGIGKSDGFSLTRKLTVGFHKMREFLGQLESC